MEYKILESNGVEIDNLDGAAFNNFAAGGQDGILEGVGNECAVYQPSNNSISIMTGVLVLSGFRIKITDPFDSRILYSISSSYFITRVLLHIRILCRYF